MAAIRILIVDDHPVVREGLKHMLELEPDMEVVGEASSGEEALDKARRFSPDVALMDIRMPGMGGIEAIRRLKELRPGLNLVVLTLYGDQYLIQAIEAGATGYILKEAQREELVQALRAAHQGQSPLHPSLSRGLFSEFAALAQGKGSLHPLLTPREMEMIRLVAAGATNKEIGARLYLSDTTVKRGMRSIFDKLEVRDRAEAVAAAHKKGLL